VLPRVLRHSNAGVPDCEHHVTAWYHWSVLAAVILVEVDVTRLDGDAPALRHRITSVYDQIHQNLI
jgi:hypothetical protein